MAPKQRVSNLSLSSPAQVGQQSGSPLAKDAPSATPPEAKKGVSEVISRVVWTLIMAYSFLALVAAGAEYVIPVVALIKIMMFWEIVRISQKDRKERQLPSMRVVQWYFLAVTVTASAALALHDPVIAYKPSLKKWYDSFLHVGAFGALVAGFVFFVLTLRRGHYRYQITQFSWLAMTLVFITAQGSLQYVNMLRGLFWFLLPISCVVHNDIWAYACGKNFGRTPLLRLSPKKTLEGFIGAWIMTSMWAFWFAGFMSRFPALICPKSALFSDVECIADPVFIPSWTPLPSAIAEFTGIDALNVAPVQLHAIAFAAFASLLAPFGGFFASGLKRAFKLKDFGDLIPGHGGMTDRMDCQIIMGAFTFVYVEFIIFGGSRGACPMVPHLVDCLRSLPPDTLRQVLSELNSK